jgi:hypothetical protein
VTNKVVKVHAFSPVSRSRHLLRLRQHEPQFSLPPPTSRNHVKGVVRSSFPSDATASKLAAALNTTDFRFSSHVARGLLEAVFSINTLCRLSLLGHKINRLLFAVELLPGTHTWRLGHLTNPSICEIKSIECGRFLFSRPPVPGVRPLLGVRRHVTSDRLLRLHRQAVGLLPKHSNRATWSRSQAPGDSGRKPVNRVPALLLRVRGGIPSDGSGTKVRFL